MTERRTTTPEGRAQSFADSAGSFSTRHFLVRGDHEPRQTIAGAIIRHKDGDVFEVAQVNGIISSLDAKAQELGGQRLFEYGPVSTTGPYSVYSFYQFSAQTLLEQNLLE